MPGVRHAAQLVVAVVSVGVLGVASGYITTSPSTDVQREVTPAALLPPATTLTRVPHETLLRPDYLSEVTDPVFGSTITRVSDEQVFAAPGAVRRPTHHKVQPWNSDGTRLLLGYSDPGFLLDGRSYAYDGGRLSHSTNGVWSNVIPDVFYSVDDNRLLSVSAKTGAVSVLHTFTGWRYVTLGNGEGSPSNDDRSIAVVAQAEGRTAVLVHDLVANETVGGLELPTQDRTRLRWAAVSQSGRFVVLQWVANGSRPGTGVELYDREMRYVRHLFPDSTAADLGYDAAGAEVYVTLDPTRGKGDGDRLPVVTVRLEDGSRTEVLSTDWLGSHVSCRNTELPGWCFVSDSEVNSPHARTGGYDEIFAVRLDGSGAVARFAHAQQSPGAERARRTRAVPSRDGTRVIWGSDWRGGPDTPVDAYVASYTRPDQLPRGRGTTR